MLQNPAYSLLSDERFKLLSYTLIRKKQKPYVLINLSEKAMHERIQFRDQTFALQEHHLSVYKEFSLSSNAAISAFHYTALSDKYSLHAYFDHNGNYLRCHVKLLADDSIIPLSIEEKLYFQRLAQSQINHPLTLILESLKEQYHQSHERLTRALAQLETLSTKKMDRKYLAAITDTLELVDTANSYTFNPDTATKNLLLSQASFVSEALNNPPKKVNPAIHAASSAQQEGTDDAEIQQKSELDELHNEKVDLLNQLNKIQKSKANMEQFKNEDKILNRLLQIIPAQDFNLILTILNRKNALEKKRKDIIKDASSKGDIGTVKEMLDPRDEFFIQELIMNALMRNQEEMIYFLYDNYKFQKPNICRKNYPTKIIVNEQPIKIMLDDIYMPILLCAYETKNFTLFCNLIDKYKENPDSEIVSPSEEFICNISLLQLFIAENELTYAKKLLESGANPNKRKYFIQEWDADKKRLVPVTSLRFDGTALHTPGSPEAVALLLKHNADTTIRDSQGYTAFGRVATNYPLNTKTLELLMATGKHSIDEPQAPQAITPLYCACEENDRKAASYFIERGANILHPVALGIEGIKIATPFALMVAIYKDVKTTRKMIEHLEQSNNPGTRKEIQKILLMGVTAEIKSILTPFYKKLCLVAAEKEHNQSKYSVAASLYKEIFARCSPPKSEAPSLWRSLGNSLTAANQLDEAKDAFDKSEEIELQCKMP